jgi:hypothetical protein
MKRLDSRNVRERSSKQLVLNRETLRQLQSKEMEHVAGGASIIPTCFPCGTKKDNDA